MKTKPTKLVQNRANSVFLFDNSVQSYIVYLKIIQYWAKGRKNETIDFGGDRFLLF